ncbi:calmodulin [Pseudoalteromonas sp. SG41-1]|uniref:calmodulin n=1 Tax=Pseudoalteromonas sp. SG41-1 TaxID=2760979 RepID=UPI0016013F27|nr:calmodulin [Pseudoalteromonas sp. SG41-1]MBB1506098.1 calmodulin [Pseudoalteromonas sp. SG41-1]
MNILNKAIVLIALTSSSAAFAFEALDFDTLDVDDNGVISQVEAAEDAELLNRFAERDTDQNGELSKEEFSKA